MKFGRLLAGDDDGLGQGDGPGPALGPVVAHDGILGPGRDGGLAHHRDLGLGIGREPVDGDDDRDAEAAGVFDVGGHVGQPLFEQGQVLVGVLGGQGLAGHDLGPAAMHLQGPDRGHDDDRARDEAARPALDVHELFHAAVGPEARFRDDETIPADEAEGDLVGDDRGVAVGDVGERSGVDDGRRVLDRLHQVGHDGVLHQDGQGPGDAEVVGRDGLARAARADDDPAEALAHVGETRRQGQDGHDLRGDGDVEAGLADHALLLRAEADLDDAQEAVADVDDAVPGDAGRVDVEAEHAALLFGGEVGGVRLVDAELLEPAEHDRGEAALALLVGRAEGVEELLVVLTRLVEDADIDGRGQEIVGGRHGVDVAGQVEVEVLHGHDLGIAAAGRAALDPERRPHAGLADDGHDVPAEVGPESLAQADGRRRLALAERGRRDGRHVDVVAQGAVLEPVEDVEVDLGLELAVEVEVILAEAESRGHLDDGQELGGLGDVDVARHGFDGLNGHGAGLLLRNFRLEAYRKELAAGKQAPALKGRRAFQASLPWKVRT